MGVLAMVLKRLGSYYFDEGHTVFCYFFDVGGIYLQCLCWGKMFIKL